MPCFVLFVFVVVVFFFKVILLSLLLFLFSLFFSYRPRRFVVLFVSLPVYCIAKMVDQALLAPVLARTIFFSSYKLCI